MNRSALHFWVDVISLLVMFGLLLTGGVIHFVLPPGSGRWATLFGWGRHSYGALHFYLAVAGLVILALHVALHWRWVCCFVAKSLNRAHPSPTTQTLAGVGLLLTVLGVAGATISGASYLVVQHADAAMSGDRNAERPGQNARRERRSGEVEAAGPIGSSHSAVESGGGAPGREERPGCPAGQQVTGRISLQEAANLAGVKVEDFARRLALPADTPAEERLGTLKRRYGFDMQAVREIVCSPH